MKNEFIWSRTLLSTYRYFERIAGAIDKIMLRKALSSGQVSAFSMYKFSSEHVTSELIDLMERKVTLINLKVLIEDCLSSIKETDAALLIDKYIGGLKICDLVEKHEISTRSVFRRIDVALCSFEKQLNFRGYDVEKLASMTRGEKWIQGVLSRFERSEDVVALSDMALERAVQ